jgi:hypothetical protein
LVSRLGRCRRITSSRALDAPLTRLKGALRVGLTQTSGLERCQVADDLIGYDRLTQEALRSVVRAALTQAASPAGLPGKHHFYITFCTRAPGVIIPDHLVNRYPDEMTIVLEHQFWDLEVYPDRFRVILKFSGQPQPIVIPLLAVTRFFDPSVKFGLQFETLYDVARLAAGDDVAPAAAAQRTLQPAAAHDVEINSAPSGVISLDAFRNKK